MQYSVNCIQYIDKSIIVEYSAPRFVCPEVFFRNLLTLRIIYAFV